MIKVDLGDVDPRIESAARAISRTLGENDDALKQTGRVEAVRTGNGVSTGPEMVEAWRFHIAEARKMTAVFDALSRQDQPSE
jgi:NAD(P)H-hydrate repair Nnr-like enzyme with NAD(P)H-hydrate dehydratase domain